MHSFDSLTASAVGALFRSVPMMGIEVNRCVE